MTKVDKLRKEISKLDAAINSATAAVADCQSGLDQAVDKLADSGDHKAVDAARRSLDQASDRLTALQRKRDRAQTDLDAAQAADARQQKSERLRVLLGEIESTIRRQKAIIGSLKFEGSVRDHRLQQMDRENRQLSAAEAKAEAVIRSLADELGEDVAEKLNGLHVAEVSDDTVRAALLDFGVSDSFCRWPLSQTRTHQRPLIP